LSDVIKATEGCACDGLLVLRVMALGCLVRWLFAVDWELAGWLVSGCMVKRLFDLLFDGFVGRLTGVGWLVDSGRYSLLWSCCSGQVVV
jgi:hypothetical protein